MSSAVCAAASERRLFVCTAVATTGSWESTFERHVIHLGWSFGWQFALCCCVGSIFGIQAWCGGWHCRSCQAKDEVLALSLVWAQVLVLPAVASCRPFGWRVRSQLCRLFGCVAVRYGRLCRHFTLIALARNGLGSSWGWSCWLGSASDVSGSVAACVKALPGLECSSLLRHERGFCCIGKLLLWFCGIGRR